jgi:CopG family transcriptional regulator, nickel-responsive regulator
MKDDLVRFGVAMERSLLEGLDGLVEARGVTRSELLRDLARAEVARAQLGRGVPAAGSLTLVYDHHVRELTERLTAAQHELGEQVRATLHVHLDHDNCLEVIVLRGRSDELQRVGDRLLATRGVKQGGLQLVADVHPEGHHAHAHAPPPRAKKTKKP